MDIPRICPGHRDKGYMVLNISRIVLNLIILTFNIIILLGFLAFSVLFNFVFGRIFLCSKCIYKEGAKFNSVKEYRESLGSEFDKRLKIMFPFLLIDWFFPFFAGLVMIIVYWIGLGATPSLTYELVSRWPIIFLMICMMLQILLTQFTLKRTPKFHCKECLYRHYCPVAQKNWNVKLDKDGDVMHEKNR